jgi:hypothetical protein
MSPGRIVEVQQKNLLEFAAPVEKLTRIKERQDVLLNSGVTFVPLDPALLPPRVTKTIVVTQNPAAGVDVPLGTTIDVKLAVKDQLPTRSLAVSTKLTTKFTTVGEITNALAPDNRGPLRKLLDSNQDYTALGDTDRAVADAFINEQLGADVSKADRITAYDDLAFIYSL